VDVVVPVTNYAVHVVKPLHGVCVHHAWRCDRFHDIRTGATLFTTSIENAFLEDTAFSVIFGRNNFLTALSVMYTFIT
jgi:hypothetical protein